MNARFTLKVFAASLLCGFGPPTCEDATVREATEALKSARAEEALGALTALEDDAPEVHLLRALAHLAREELDEARGSLDAATEAIARTVASGEGTEHTRALRLRVAFARGLVALAAEEWETALTHFGQVLRLDPDDADARWNMELAWHRANPPCHARDDDHERDDTRKDAGPYDPQKAQARRLCPANEDWYALGELPEGATVTVGLKGELAPQDEDETRDVSVRVFSPRDGDEQPTAEAKLEGGQANLGVYQIATGGPWHVQVAGPGLAEVTYDLQIQVVPPCPADDQAEENDTPETAHALPEQGMEGLKACPMDPDWYALELPAETEKQLTVSYNEAWAALEVVLFDGQTNAPLAVGKAGPGGVSFSLPKADEARRYLLRVGTMGGENIYAVKLGDGDGQDQQDQNKDQQDQQDRKDQNKDQQDQNEDQQDQNKDQQDQNKDQETPKPPEPEPEPQEDEVDIKKLMKALDEQERNPQLEKALKDLRVMPRMEDY